MWNFEAFCVLQETLLHAVIVFSNHHPICTADTRSVLFCFLFKLLKALYVFLFSALTVFKPIRDSLALKHFRHGVLIKVGLLLRRAMYR